MTSTNRGRRARRTTYAIGAALLAATLLLGSAYAYSDYSQTIRSSTTGLAASQALLHDDFNSQNKDVYVENIGSTPLLVRVKFVEYLQLNQFSALDDIFHSDTKGDINDVTTWATHTWGDAVTDTACDGSGAECHRYYTWVLGSASSAQKYYLSGVTEPDADGRGGLTETAFDALGVDDEVTVNNITTRKKQAAVPSDPVLLKTYNTILKAKDTCAAAADHNNHATAGDVCNDCGYYTELDTVGRWLLDTDGWAYWSQPLQPDTATNLLLDAVNPADAAPAYETWAYNIDVQMQAITPAQADGWYADNVTTLSARNSDELNAVANPDNTKMTATQEATAFLETYVEEVSSTAAGGSSAISIDENNVPFADGGSTLTMPTTADSGIAMAVAAVLSLLAVGSVSAVLLRKRREENEEDTAA